MALKPYRESGQVADVEEETVKDKVEEDFVKRMGPVLKEALADDFGKIQNQFGAMDKRLQSIEASSSSTAATLSTISKQIEELVKKVSGRQTGSAA